MKRRTAAPLTALTLVTLFACGQREATDRPNLVEVTTSDYAFEAPDEIPAGLTTFRMNAGGSEFHHVQIVKFDDGKTLADFNAALEAGGTPPEWAHALGGPNGADPGGTAEVTLLMTPGSYALVCFIPSPDGVPHIAKGMMRPLTVTGAAVASGRPQADIVVTMREFNFELSAPVTAGRQRVLVVNDGQIPHEVIFVHLVEGRSAADVMHWVETGFDGPPPGSGMGGTAGIGDDNWNLLEFDFEQGQRYAIFCFIPAADGQPHTAHGMYHEFMVE